MPPMVEVDRFLSWYKLSSILQTLYITMRLLSLELSPYARSGRIMYPNWTDLIVGLYLVIPVRHYTK